jgi:hypothetical protein
VSSEAARALSREHLAVHKASNATSAMRTPSHSVTLRNPEKAERFRILVITISPFIQNSDPLQQTGKRG